MLYYLLFSYGNANTNKTLIVELPLTQWLVGLLQIFFLLFYALKITLLDALLNYGTNTMLRNGTPSTPSDLVFNIARYPSRVMLLISSTLN